MSERSTYDTGLDILGATEAPTEAAIPVTFDHAVRIQSPWWQDVAIVIGALASVATLWRVFSRK